MNLSSYGREGDTELAHINPFEAKPCLGQLVVQEQLTA
jgi:hypothetical protein